MAQNCSVIPPIDFPRSLSADEKKGKDTVLDRDESFLWNHFMLKEMLLFRSHLEEHDRDQMDAGGLLVSNSRPITCSTQKGVAMKVIGLVLIVVLFLIL